MNKFKLLGILVLVNFATFQLTVSAESKNTKVNEHVKGEKKSNEYAIKNYDLQQVVKKDDSIDILLYNNKKSNAKVMLVKNKDEFQKTIVDFEYTPTPSLIFFKYNNVEDAFLTNIFGNLIHEDLYEKMREELLKTEFKSMFYYLCRPNSYEDYTNSGVYIGIKQFTPKIVDALIDELNNPKFLSNSKILKNSLNRIKMRLENEKFYEQNLDDKSRTYLTERFLFSKPLNIDLNRELEKCEDVDYLKKQYKKLINPSNCLLVVDDLSKPNFEEVMKKFDDGYFSKPDYEYYKTKKPAKFDSFINEEPFRKIEVQSLGKVCRRHPEWRVESYINKDTKYMARIYWDISTIPLEIRDVFLLKRNSFFEMIQGEIEKMGYSFVGVLDDEGNVTFDKLFCLDIKGKDKNKFKKDVLEENSKKIVKMFYDKFKDIKKEDVVEMYRNDSYAYDSSRYFRDMPFSSYCYRSFSLTNNPFSEEYFRIKNGSFENYYEKIFDIYSKHKNSFEHIYNNNPKYIDVLKINNGLKTQNKEFLDIENPLFLSGDNSGLKILESAKAGLAKVIITDLFLRPNLYETGLVKTEDFFPYICNIRKEDLEKVRKYLFEDFKNKVQNFKPTTEQFNKYKEKYIKNLEFLLNVEKKGLKRVEEILNNPNKFKKFAQYYKLKRLEECEKDKLRIKQETAEMELIKKVTDKDDKTKKEHIKLMKNIIHNMKKSVNEIEKHKNDEEYFYDKAKKNIKSYFSHEVKRSELEKAKKAIEEIKQITYEDFIAYLKKLKFKPSLKILESGK